MVPASDLENFSFRTKVISNEGVGDKNDRMSNGTPSILGKDKPQIKN